MTRRDTYQVRPSVQRTPTSLLWVIGIQSAWLLFVSVRRILIQLNADLALDALPFISFVLGAVGFATIGVLIARGRP